MFAYDTKLLATVRNSLQTIAEVLQTMQAIDDMCVDGDGLKWFNRLYLQVTQAVEARVSGGEFADAAWIAQLDVFFARLYFSALAASLAGGSTPGCWQALFSLRNQTDLARIQFAMAGINAHINHDLALAIVATCQAAQTSPQHGMAHYNDYTALNTTLDSLINTAKTELNVRLLGDALPPVSHLEDVIAAWGVAAAREAAWNNSEILWHLLDVPNLYDSFLDTLDGLTTVAGKSLLVAVP